MFKLVAITVISLGVVMFLTLGSMQLFGSPRWEKKSAALLKDLGKPRGEAEQQRQEYYRVDQLDGLPIPVARYLERVLQPGVPIIDQVEIIHRGRFNVSQKQEKWKTFRSRQNVTTAPAGFLWDAEVALFPGLKARVHDAYLQGEGILKVFLAGIVPVVDLEGGGKLAHGELMRYLAETAWYPTALLPGRGVTWKSLGDYRALATLKEGENEVSLEFTFSKEYLIESVYSPGRDRMTPEGFESAPWEGRWNNYQWREGVLVPHSGEVLWHTEEGEFPYWRGEISGISFNPGKEG